MSASLGFGLCSVRTAALAVLFLTTVSASAQMSVVGSVTPRQLSYIGTATFSASASGGDAATTKYAFFRRRPGGTWIPDINAPAWQSGSSYNWNPALSDVGVWETYVWVKDGNTPANQNTYGYAAGHNSQPIEVFGPPTVPGPTAASCDYSASGECWVTGDFVASVSPASGGLGSLVYQICRSNDTTGWGGCDANLTLNGGTSITVSGSHLPADGYRRAYYFMAWDSAGALGGWNTPLFVRVDRYAPSVGASNASDLWYSSRTATISASDSHSGLQSVRYSWNSAPNSSCTTGTAASSGTTLTVPAGDNLLYVCGRDNTGRVGQWSGRYRVAPMSVSGTVSPSRGSYLSRFTSTASASGGTPSTTSYAFFRRRIGGPWIPAVTIPNWQSSNVHSWQPALADVGTWETYIWVKDGNTPSNANTYGYAAGVNTGLIEVVGPPAAPGPTTGNCAYTASGECWVAGDFTASVAASTGGMGTLVYQICRSNDTTGFGGCDVNLTLTGGTSIVVSGTHLPSDGYRRAYYFQAKDSAGAYSGWNTPLYVRVDRHVPVVSATNASDTEWFPSRTATVSASDSHSGVQAVRYAWNAALNAACTTGTATSPGAVLTAPVGDNTLYLCAKDNTARVAQWSSRYRVSAPLGLTCSVSPARGSYANPFTWTATASGGNPSTIRYAFFRRRPGGAWIPDVTIPNWQAGNVYSWTPGQANVGMWETYVWVKDGNTPANQNTYGYAAGCNSGPIEVVGPPTVPGATTVSCVHSVAATGDCWVTGDFTASVAASTGGMGSLVYQICRSIDSAGGVAGCDVNLTLTGGTSIAVSGTHLPADGYRRAYYFQAKDASGGLSGWNTPKYVRVDRYVPVVSATNASDIYFSSRTATVAASDAGAGVQSVRYSWNTALDAGCTTGTATSPGAALIALAGDNLLYLCAKDNTGRVGQWSGRYRVSPLGLTGTVSPARASHLGTFTSTATASGGTPSTISYAFFRRRIGGPWIPDVTIPNWQPGNVYTWKPALADVGTWETYIWVKDGDTPASMNTHGYAAGFNTGLIEVVGPPTKPGATTVSCAWSNADDCWVAGNFTASVTASTGGMGSLVYQICRSNDTAGLGGCDVNLTLTGGTSIAVSSTHLPADGLRRAYYFQAKDSAGALSGWNTPKYVRVDRYAPTVSATNASDVDWFPSRTATVSASDAAGAAGFNSGLLEVRYRWNAALDAACTTGTVTSPGAILTAPVGDNVLYLCARDNVSRVTQWSGRYRVSAPLSLTCSVSPARGSYVSPFTWTATASGGNPSTIRYALFRRRPGGTWIPAMTAPTWQAGNVFTWTPIQADAGMWESSIWVKDGNTPATQNTYGYAVGCNPGPIEVAGPPTKPGPTTVSCAYSVAATSDCWVTGDFTASVTASTGGMGSLVYQICRSIDSPGGFAGCDVNLTLTGGTSIAVSGTHLPADGFRRAYYFQAKDSAGALSGWNTPRYVRVDRAAPTVSATNASEEWFTSRTATVSASDTGSGLLALRHSWNTALDAACTNGTVVASGTVLTVPDGDNLLYLCARDKVGRVMQWSGRYRVENVPAPVVTSVAPFVISQGTMATLTVTGSNLLGATVYVPTQPFEDTDPVRVFPTAELLGINAAGTSLTVRIDTQASGIAGFYNLAVETRGGKTAGQFRVVGTAPVVDVMTPSQPVQGNIHVLMLGGANLQGAEIVPLDPGIKVLDLDNSDDKAAMGLLYVDSDAPVGEYQIRVQKPGGESLTLSLEVVGSAAAASVTTTEVEVPGRSLRPDVPQVYLQEPVRLPSAEDSGFQQLMAAPSEEEIASSTAPWEVCFIAEYVQIWQFSAILLSLSDAFTTEPLTREVLNRLAPGERINFNSTTVAVSAWLGYRFFYRVCNDWVTSLGFCVGGGISYMVPFVGGHGFEFNLCAGNGGTDFDLSAEGGITRHEWSASGPCITIGDADPESESGERSGEIAMNCCSPTDISVDMAGTVFNTQFQAQGTVMSVQPQSCVDLDNCNKKIEWRYLKSDGTEGPAITGPVELLTTADQRQAKVTVDFVPEGGSFQETAWTGGGTLLTRSGESTNGARAQVTLTAELDPGPGSATVTTPLYRWEALECRADVAVRVSAVEVEVNLTPDRNDDMVEVKSNVASGNRRKTRVRVRLPATAPNDVTVVVTNPDGRLRFPETADTTKTLTLPKGVWVEFEISGEVRSDAKDDAVIELHQDTADGTLLARRTVTVFYFASEIKVIPGGYYSLVPLTSSESSFTATGTPAVTFEAQATLHPSGLDCTASPLKDLYIGLVQNVKTERLVYFDNPTIACLPGNRGKSRTVPAARAVRTRIVNELNDSEPAHAPLYSKRPQALALPHGCLGGGGGTATEVDTPKVEVNLSLAIQPSSPGGVPEGTVTYQFDSVTMADNFKIWAVSYDSVTDIVVPLRESEWYLQVDSAVTTPQRATAITFDRAPTFAPVVSGPFFNEEIQCVQPTDPGCKNKTTLSSGTTTLVCP
ncbi:MAG TPA: hypothetical protein VNW71_05830 [Thermoanaerobaculia bacterium]|nr:hypothetical protein [Thermoanaerobaculia bacterium]